MEKSEIELLESNVAELRADLLHYTKNAPEEATPEQLDTLRRQLARGERELILLRKKG